LAALEIRVKTASILKALKKSNEKSPENPGRTLLYNSEVLGNIVKT
jgi:hypothetical protein